MPAVYVRSVPEARRALQQRARVEGFLAALVLLASLFVILAALWP